MKTSSLLLLALPFAASFQVNTNRKTAKIHQSAIAIDEQFATAKVLLPEPSEEPTSMNPVSIQVQQAPQEGYTNPGVSTWMRRLVTKGDFMAAHKISGIAFVGLSTFILGTGIVTGGQVPDFLEPSTYLFAITMLVQMVSSIDLSYKFRSDPSERRTMIGNAIVSAYAGVMTLWASPFAPSFMDIPEVSKAINIAFNVPIFLSVIDSLLHVNESFDVKKGNDVEKSFLVNAGIFMVPLIIGLFTGSFSMYLYGFEHDRAWFVDMIDSGVLDQGLAFYNPLVNAVYTSYLSLFWTLRDRKLISRQQEQTGNAFLVTAQFIFGVATFGPVLSHHFSP